MVERIVSVQVDGVDLLVQAVLLPGSEQTSGVGKAGERVIEGFDAAQAAIGVIATRLSGTVKDLADRAVTPDQVQVEFGLSFTASGNVLLAGSTAGASLRVSITYDRRDSPATPRALGVGTEPCGPSSGS